VLKRDEWLNVARKVDWNFRYVTEVEVYPEELSGGHPWRPSADWKGWEEAYRNTYREYVETQLAKDDSILAVREALSKGKITKRLDPLWIQLLKLHNGLVALGEFSAGVAELRMARFGRDGAWRTMANLGAMDEIRHTQIPLLLGHDLLRFDPNFDWTHKLFHTNEWAAIAGRHAFDDLFVAANAVDTAIQLTFVFETGFTNLQFVGLAAMADGADDHLFERAVVSIQTDEARHAQIGHPTLEHLIEHGGKEYAQYLLDKSWWRSWRLFAALTGTSMDYMTPLEARKHSFKEFMQEWIIEQFLKNLEEFGLQKPWFWDTFLEQIDYYHHTFYLGGYTYRPTLWMDWAVPNPDERDWLREKYPNWAQDYEPIWENIERNWATKGESATLPYTLPVLCNMCQIPTCYPVGRVNTVSTVKHNGRNYVFCSEPCRWIFEQEKIRYAEHKTVLDRVFSGEAPTDFGAVLEWMGFDDPAEMGKDLHGGHHPWRVPELSEVHR
jgi:toluene monooxygenase system protein A